VTITNVDGMEVSLNVFDKEENKTYNWTTFSWIIWGNSKNFYDPSNFTGLWPLQVGYQFKAQYQKQRRYSPRKIKGEVTRTEIVKVPTGEFFTFLIEITERVVGHPERQKMIS